MRRSVGTGLLRLGFAVLAALACDAPTTPATAPTSDAARPPNIVLLISDDHGYPDYGFMGSPHVRTPEIDRLAREGVVFSHGYSTASVCRPALASLLTGVQPLQIEAWEGQWLRDAGRGKRRSPLRSRSDSFAARLETLPRLLSEAGYATYQAGKHWEGSYADAGFDEGMIAEQKGNFGGGQIEQLIREDMDPVLDFVERNADRPFFLWFAPLLPHLPHDAPERYQVPYAGLEPGKARYYAAISWLDDGIGQLLARFRELGIEERTLFVYLADNGWDPERDEGYSGTVGGRKGKVSLYELGLRTPIILSWQGGIEPQPARSELVSFVDVYATILDYAGVALPPQREAHSLRPLLEDGAPWPRTDLVGWQGQVRSSPPHSGPRRPGSFWRDARWHYLEPTVGEAQLFDLEADPWETRNVVDEHPEVVARAKARLDAWGRSVTQRELPLAPPSDDTAPTPRARPASSRAGSASPRRRPPVAARPGARAPAPRGPRRSGSRGFAGTAPAA